MRPLKVEFQAFGPYPGHETVDLEALAGKGLFLICGKTGIGKTMILDAMTFALYGKSSGHSRDDFLSMRCTNADFDTPTFVRFEFENNGKYYLFERRLERKRKNLSPSYNVSLKSEEGIWEPLMENPKERALNDKATEIIGLDFDQFRQVIILPQGQFEKLLTSNSEEKEKILTSIFGEAKWQEIAEIFYDEAEKRRNALKDIKTKIENSLSDEGCSTPDELKLLIKSKEEALNTLDTDYKSKDLDTRVKTLQESLSTAKRFSDLHRAEDRVKELLDKKEERARMESRAGNAKRAEKVRPLTEAVTKAEEALKLRKKDEDAALKKAEKADSDYAGISEKAALHAEKAAETESLRSEKIKCEGKLKDYEELDSLEAELKEKEKALASAQKAEDKAKAECLRISENVVKLQNEFSALSSEHETLLNAYLSGITGELAEQLKDGEPCPVCGSLSHPHKAEAAPNSVTRAQVASKKEEMDRKYKELQSESAAKEKADKLLEEKRSETGKAKTEAAARKSGLESLKKGLVSGISTSAELKKKIDGLTSAIDNYEKEKERLAELERTAKEACTKAAAGISAAKKETAAAEKAAKEAREKTDSALKKNGFDSLEEAEELMLSEEDLNALSSRIARYDADLKTANESLSSLKEELKGKKEPDPDECREGLDKADSERREYSANRAVLSREIERLQNKLSSIEAEGEGIVDKLREAEEDSAFAKRLRGDSGTGLQRYVLGIMFSSVVAAANKMLELVHGGRYRLFRSDEKAQGSNKRGLELKVFDQNSGDPEGRFVSTLSGGEKFLVSLALSIGLSTVAKKSGIKTEALFIDEGFGSLDEDSIGDAMNVLKSIQEANGLVGIISHVGILQDQIPSKLVVEEDGCGSRIVRSLG